MGPVDEVDMGTVRTRDIVRIKVGTVDLGILPIALVLTTPKKLMYEATFQLEQVVEAGWFAGKNQGKRSAEEDTSVEDLRKQTHASKKMREEGQSSKIPEAPEMKGKRAGEAMLKQLTE
ncbi:hypothetical protein E2562_019404 [Oryza meyeriana var. granulata]|uniref:Uncharacterized protein n=1 Tax=Oryza meyeriana var. granulata TaxID=110450 RepID=A0A6G1DL29_9ORYZ|nr:hypothetical protein E2562_019404 [Oryza meyeriana var. granulata]